MAVKKMYFCKYFQQLKASFFLPIYGLTHTIAMPVAGIFGDKIKNRLLLHGIFLLLGGIVTLVFLLASTFEALAIYIALHGIINGEFD